jgi:hypothetical protein
MWPRGMSVQLASFSGAKNGDGGRSAGKEVGLASEQRGQSRKNTPLDLFVHLSAGQFLVRILVTDVARVLATPLSIHDSAGSTNKLSHTSRPPRPAHQHRPIPPSWPRSVKICLELSTSFRILSSTRLEMTRWTCLRLYAHCPEPRHS